MGDAGADVAGDAVAVKPRLAAVDVADVDEVAEGGILGTAITADNHDVVLGRKGDGDGVVEIPLPRTA